jgi:hypothetical protein
MREATVALLVCNLPFVWSLIGDCFPRLREWAGKNDLESTPRFWRERKRKGSYFCCIGDRRNSSEDGMSSFVMQRNAEGVDAKHVENIQETGIRDVTKLGGQHAEGLIGKMETAVIAHMRRGELEDDLDVDLLTDREIFLEIESAVVSARSQPMSPGFSEDIRPDTAKSPSNGADSENKSEKSRHCNCCTDHVVGEKHE